MVLDARRAHHELAAVVVVELEAEVTQYSTRARSKKAM